MDRIIAHLDMDAFFASVEERDKPYLKGAPIVIGADPQGGSGRGVVSTASYAARAYGIGSAMPISKAWTASEAARMQGKPACIFITGGFEKYTKASREVFALVSEYVPCIEKVSVDEAYLDITFTKSFPLAEVFVRNLQEEIMNKTGLTCSVGIAPNKLVAKIASEVHKPSGITIAAPARIKEFLAPMPIRAIPGIGPKAAELCRREGVRTIGDAQELSLETLKSMYGSRASSMRDRFLGIDEREVVAERPPRKSIGHHHTFSSDTYVMEDVFTVLREQAAEIHKRVVEEGYTSFRTVTVTMRFDTFETKTRAVTSREGMTSLHDLEARAIKLALPFFDARDNPQKRAIRLVGLRVTGLRV